MSFVFVVTSLVRSFSHQNVPSFGGELRTASNLTETELLLKQRFAKLISRRSLNSELHFRGDLIKSELFPSKRRFSKELHTADNFIKTKLSP